MPCIIWVWAIGQDPGIVVNSRTGKWIFIHVHLANLVEYSNRVTQCETYSLISLNGEPGNLACDVVHKHWSLRQFSRSYLAIEQALNEALALLPLQTTRTSPDTFFHGLLLAYRTFSRLLPYYSILFQPIYPLSLRQRRTWIRRGTRLISGCPFQRPPRSCSSDGAGHNTTALTTQPRGGHDLDNVVGIFGDVSELCDDWLPHGRDLANECMARAQMLIEFDKMHSPSFRHKIGKHK